MGAVLHQPWCRLDETLFAALDYPGDVMLKIQLFASAPMHHSQGFDVFYPPDVLHRFVAARGGRQRQAARPQQLTALVVLRDGAVIQELLQMIEAVPADVAHGVLFVADSGNHCLRRITPDGVPPCCS